jgi:S1-C subfamily serine protease
MIGLTTALAAVSNSETAGGFAVPMDERMQRIVRILKEGREVEYGFLGVTLWGASRRRGEGVEIREVIPGSPAARAHLQPYDLIVSVNGIRVYEEDDLFVTVGTLLAGTEVNLEFIQTRSGLGPGLHQTARVTLAKFYVPPESIIVSHRPSFRGLRIDFTSLLLRPLVFPRPMPEGVLVSAVEPGSPAAAAGLKVNEIITHVNDRPVNTPAEFYDQTKRKGPVELTLAATDMGKLPLKVKID